MANPQFQEKLELNAGDTAVIIRADGRVDVVGEHATDASSVRGIADILRDTIYEFGLESSEGFMRVTHVGEQLR